MVAIIALWGGRGVPADPPGGPRVCTYRGRLFGLTYVGGGLWHGLLGFPRVGCSRRGSSWWG
jgi:hypothetical protein